MTATRDDHEIIRVLKQELFTAVVGDVLDVMGLRKQFLPAQISPLQPHMKIAGRAMPVLQADIFDDAAEAACGPLARKPFGLMLEALDSLKPGEIYVASGASFNYALWGGLMSTRATQLRAGGAVVNGYVRDSWDVERLDYPTFCRGLYAQDQGPRGKVIDFNTTVEIGAARIRPGDFIFGDREGVLVIPREAEQEAIARALEKAATENEVAIAIRNGMGAAEAFEKYGVM
ncbi:RraA family protein [Pelagibacterium lentulum]|uniref:Demethylmenaquinone methyltransferase n=1 Tax=Pelagibacterium lentulum TaxID=2029865 RepID=A0A916W1X8_9HYPH|nr:RraA family protein [Pelagibacterium lentulum]GGA59433.1 demethylmenaquinone methyltransferase [Pelagibacterium lentulum]